MTSKVEKRRREIQSILEQDGVVYVADTARLFAVTSETIRGDFDVIAQQQGFTRIHGGLKRDNVRPVDRHYRFTDNKRLHVETKRRLCRRAAELISDGDHLYLDGGSTVSYMPDFLMDKSDLVVVTPSLAVLMAYIRNGFAEKFEKNGNTLVLAGGTVSTKVLTTHGPLFAESVQNLQFDKMVFSVDALDLKAGGTNADELAFSIMRVVADKANTRILLADASKFGRIANYRAVPWERIHYLGTDAELDANWRKTLAGHGVSCFHV